MAGTDPALALTAVLREKLAAARWWVREFSGESAYDKYLARHRRDHGDHPPMTEREFWRSRDRFHEHNVSSGCC